MGNFISLLQLSTSIDIAKIFPHHIIRLLGFLTPELLTELQFTSRVWSLFCNGLDMEVCLSISYYPQTDRLKDLTNVSNCILFLSNCSLLAFMFTCTRMYFKHTVNANTTQVNDSRVIDIVNLAPLIQHKVGILQLGRQVIQLRISLDKLTTCQGSTTSHYASKNNKKT